MAVAFSTGGSGYMRSDFMISDAALPQRLEELEQHEQKSQFADILGEIGEAPKAKKAAPDKTEVLAKAVVDGEVKLEDIPQEMVTEDLLSKIAAIMAAMEEKEVKDDPQLQALMSELAVFFTAQPERAPQDMSEEITQLTAKAERVQTEEVQPQIVPAQLHERQTSEPTEAPMQVNEQTEVQFTVEQDIQVLPAVQSIEASDEAAEFVLQTELPAEQPSSDVVVQPKNTAAAQVVEQAAQQPDAEAQQSFYGGGERSQEQSTMGGRAMQQTASAAPVKAEQAVDEFAGVREAMNNVRTRSVEHREAPVQQNEEQAIQLPQEQAAVRNPVADRVVSKSDELMMIKNSAKTAKNDTDVQQSSIAQPMAPAESGVMIRRADGSTVTVKPTEVIEQAAVKITEQAQQMTERELEYTVTLDPEDLGRITVKLTKAADGAVSVSVAAENSRTQRILEENAAVLQNSLKNSGIQLESWQVVDESRQENYAQDYQGSSKNPYHSEEQSSEPEAEDNTFAELIASM